MPGEKSGPQVKAKIAQYSCIVNQYFIKGSISDFDFWNVDRHE